MKVTLDVTNHFHLLDFCDATLGFEPTRHLNRTLTFPVWNAQLQTQLQWPAELQKPPGSSSTSSMQMCGDVSLELDGICGGEIRISLYDTQNSKVQFYENEDGEVVTLKRNWPIEQSAQHRCFWFMSILEWPYGDCELKLWTTGKTLIHFDSEKLIVPKGSRQ